MKKIIFSSLAITAMVAGLVGVSYAVFSDTETIEGNTLSTATVDIDLRALSSGTIEKPLDLQNFVPGQVSDWARAEIFNQGTTEVNLYMYVENTAGAACDAVNLEVRTGHAGGDELEREVYNGALLDIEGDAQRVEVTGVPPFATLGAGITQVIQQRAELDSSADNSYQGTSCTWDEVFVAESVAP